jgi:hypothetical protein
MLMSDGAAPPDDEPTEIIVSVTTEPARSDDDGLDIDRKLAPRARAFPAGPGLARACVLRNPRNKVAQARDVYSGYQ